MLSEVDEQFIKDVVLNTVDRCGSCGHLYEADNVNVVAHEEGLWLLMMNCPACSSRGLVAALIKDQLKLGSAHDATNKEPQDVRKIEPVCADDILEIHEFLKNFDGDFISLFNKPQ